ncbi:conjugative transposon protein TraJ [Parafilimonas sp.]|uniref:conjugative transposon protein TraJ n=1 Tax=Parafilimonas sp. TaxID=1969739 RepID=UPI0039E2CFA3
MAKCRKAAWMAAVGLGLPFISHAQGLADEMKGMHGVLDQLYDEMMPLCGQLIGVAQGLAGFAAMWYIAARVWRHLANAEPIDFYPLFRPFAIGFCVLIFPSVLAIINGVMKPTVTATAAMVENSDKAIAVLLQQKEDAIKHSDVWQMYVGANGSGDRDKWYKYTHNNADPSGEGWMESIGNDIRFSMAKLSYNFRNSVKEWMSEVLRVLFEAAALCIDTLRTFQLVVLAILGPLVFGLSVFDGFQHTLTAWLARYINIYLWLPVANIFGSIIGKIQEKMLQLDLSQIQTQGDTFFSSTDAAYLVFMIIGIVGYFTVPSVANYIVHAGGGGGGALGQKFTSVMSSAATTTAGRLDKGLDNMASLPKYYKEGYSGAASGEGVAGAAGRALGNTSGYMADKLKGK